jgi:hypothetical protein
MNNYSGIYDIMSLRDIHTNYFFPRGGFSKEINSDFLLYA